MRVANATRAMLVKANADMAGREIMNYFMHVCRAGKIRNYILNAGEDNPTETTRRFCT